MVEGTEAMADLLDTNTSSCCAHPIENVCSSQSSVAYSGEHHGEAATDGIPNPLAHADRCRRPRLHAVHASRAARTVQAGGHARKAAAGGAEGAAGRADLRVGDRSQRRAPPAVRVAGVMPAPRSRAMRVLVCPQEFKGALTAIEAATAIAAGVRSAFPGAEVAELPMADGGPGTVAIVARATGARLVRHTATGPLGDPVTAAYALLVRHGEATLAMIEAAATAGLLLVPPERRDPTRATSVGVGEQIRHAIAGGAREVIVGVGGTATNDGGAGAAQALGLRLLDGNGESLPRGGLALVRLARVEAPIGAPAAAPADTPIDPIDVDAVICDLNLRIAVDVRNPLLGPSGATAVYGAQKGVADWQAPALDAALAHWARRLRDDLRCDVAAQPGAGAGGGIPTGLLAACPRGRIESGAALVANAIGLRGAIEAADLVITGEGAMDAQTAYGKAVAHVAALAAETGTPCVAVAGIVEGLPAGILNAEALAPTSAGHPAETRQAAAYVAAAAARLIRRWAAGN
ncbi:MAG: glycerate kinase [Dehalococcoidia bacterium]|nr:glycerate kinase [Dehalococcoidia bacterium]